MTYKNKTVEELKNICRIRNIKGYSKLRKDEIIKLIKKNMKGGNNITNYQTIFNKLIREVGININSNNNYYLSLESDKNATYWSGKIIPNTNNGKSYTNKAKNMLQKPDSYNQATGPVSILNMVVRSSEDGFQSVSSMRVHPLYYSKSQKAFLVEKDLR